MGRFFLGFALGVAIGAAAAYLASPKSARSQIGQTIRGAIEAGQRASAQHEAALWAEYRKRLPTT
jgi:gas vesicle protein